MSGPPFSFSPPRTGDENPFIMNKPTLSPKALRMLRRKAKAASQVRSIPNVIAYFFNPLACTRPLLRAE